MTEGAARRHQQVGVDHLAHAPEWVGVDEQTVVRQVERAKLRAVALREDTQRVRQPQFAETAAQLRYDRGHARHVGRILGVEVVTVPAAYMNADARKRLHSARLVQPVLAPELADERLFERPLVVADAEQGLKDGKGEREVDGIARVGRFTGAEVELRFPGGGPLGHRPVGVMQFAERRVAVGEAVGAGKPDGPHGEQRLRSRALECRAAAGDPRDPGPTQELPHILPVQDVGVGVAMRAAKHAFYDVLRRASQVAQRPGGEKAEGRAVHTSLPSSSSPSTSLPPASAT